MSAPVERALRDVTLFPLWLDNPAAPTPERPLSDPQAALGQGHHERPFLAESCRWCPGQSNDALGSIAVINRPGRNRLLSGGKQT